jgi:hypothetical protein
VTLFVPSPEIENRNAVEVNNWAKLPSGSFLWDECANALIKRVFYVIF